MQKFCKLRRLSPFFFIALKKSATVLWLRRRVTTPRQLVPLYFHLLWEALDDSEGVSHHFHWTCWSARTRQGGKRTSSKSLSHNRNLEESATFPVTCSFPLLFPFQSSLLVVFVCVFVCFSVFVGSETWIFTYEGSNNLCGDKILDPTTLTLNFRVKTSVYW